MRTHSYLITRGLDVAMPGLVQQLKEVSHNLGFSILSLHFPQQIGQISRYHYQIQRQEGGWQLG